jgi:pSer/pThr/pTyr-binding forkhead associated (FHA) protein
MGVKLIVASGKAKGREIPLPSTIFIIGRGTRCHLRMHSRRVSKLHCAIARWAGKVVVRDLKSCNGTLVNGKPITGEAKVNDGDTLQVGPLAFTFQIQQAAEDPPVQIVGEGEVRWLLEVPEDPADVADALAQTAEIPIPVESDSPPAGEDVLLLQRDADEGLSAGQHLREYLRERRR